MPARTGFQLRMRQLSLGFGSLALHILAAYCEMLGEIVAILLYAVYVRGS